MQNATSKLCSAHGIAKWLTTIKNAMPNACLTQETNQNTDCVERERKKKKKEEVPLESKVGATSIANNEIDERRPIVEGPELNRGGSQTTPV